MKKSEKLLETVNRKFPIGAELIENEGVHFRVWAQSRKSVQVVIEYPDEPDKNTTYDLLQEENGYYSALVNEAEEGNLYRFILDEEKWVPDPVSRFQPFGPHGPSQIINPKKFIWTDENWKGANNVGQIIYEMHVGTFTSEGTWEAAEKELPELKSAGITLIEMMPIADFPGRFGWGYDGVNLFAPAHLYGTPDNLKSFINTAHENEIAVILDVVYNHIGPDGNFMKEFSPDYFTSEYKTDWGEAINFDGKNSKFVREYFISNALYWIDEFHFDGLRFDATQNIYDKGAPHILAEIVKTARQIAGEKKLYFVAENEPQEVKLVRPFSHGGYGIDALWNDDFHHSAMVALTGHNEAYYTDYEGKPQEFISALKYGYLYQGQKYKWQGKARGTSALKLSPNNFVNFIQNHDQIANSGRGLRANHSTSFGRYKALTALFLLAPGTPMIFQGQEFGASSPFFYFADHKEELAVKVREGRIEFLRQFRSLATPEIQAWLPNPVDPLTFVKSKLDFSERTKNASIYSFHKDLIKIRIDNPVFCSRVKNIDGAVLSNETFVIRYFQDEDQDKLLLVNLGIDLHLDPAPEPLLAPFENCTWEISWSSEDPKYGGVGTSPVYTLKDNWRIPGHAAVLLSSAKIDVEETEEDMDE